jgi:multiple sugar transport system permease protein
MSAVDVGSERQAVRSETGARPRAVSVTQRSRRRSIALWSSVVVILLFCLAPFYWLLNVSLRNGPDLSVASLFPHHPTLSNYTSVLSDGDFLRALLNSAIVATSTTAIALVVGSFAGYALARLPLRGKHGVLFLFLAISTFPPISIAAPVFKLWTDLGLYNTYLGLILPCLAFALPLAVYILTSFFREVPKELEEAARVDGATRMQAFRKIVLPLAAPGLVTAGLLTFIATWNEFLFAITLTSSPEARTVPAAIAFFTGSQQFEVPLGTITAASVIITVPLIVLVIVFQRRIIAGLTAGAIKG